MFENSHFFFFFFLNPSLSINDTSIMMSEKVLSELHFEDGEWSVRDPGSSAQEVVTPGSSQERPLVTPAPVTRSGGDGTMTIQHQARISVGGGDRPNLVLAQVQVFCPGLDLDLDWDLDLSLTIDTRQTDN